MSLDNETGFYIVRYASAAKGPTRIKLLRTFGAWIQVVGVGRSGVESEKFLWLSAAQIVSLEQFTPDDAPPRHSRRRRVLPLPV